MTCEFLSGLTQLPFPSTSVVVGAGGITTGGTLYLYLTARNRAGWTIASSPVVVTFPANASITVTLPAAARGVGTDFIRYSFSANTANNPIAAYQLGEWENYQADEYTRRTLNPIVLSRNEHVNPAGSVAVPADLPTGLDLVPGMHRLVIGGFSGATTSSYYRYSVYTTKASNGIEVIEPHAGEKWLRVSNPFTAQVTDPDGIGGCAIDVRLVDTGYILPPPLYDPVQANPVKGIPIKLTWHNNSTIALESGTNFGLEVRQGAENRTDSFNGKLILTLKGYTDGLGGLDRFDAGGINTLPNVDVDRVWGYTDDAIGILTLDKDLPAGASVVYEIAPYFTAQQFQGNLAANELISIYLYPYTQSGKNVGSLWAITGDMVLPVSERMHVLPAMGLAVNVMAGSAIVKGYTFTLKPDQTVGGLQISTANQNIVVDGNGVCAVRQTPLGSEAIRAIVSTAMGTSKLGALSLPITVAASGRVELALNYDDYAGDDLAQIRSDYPVIGGDVSSLNPTFVRLFAYDGSVYYPALSAGATNIGVVPDFTQLVTIDSLGAPIAAPTNPVDPFFGLFAPPTINGFAATGGLIAAGSYQFFAVYYYDGSVVSKIDHTDPTVIRESQLSIADLYLLNQGWGRPVNNPTDLRSVPRDDVYSWQQRPVAGSIFYFDPTSLLGDDGGATFKPNHLATSNPGRWLIRRSDSINPITAPWNVTTTYKYLDLVSFGGGSYLYIYPTPSTGILIENPAYWLVIAEKGSTGERGYTGRVSTFTSTLNPFVPTVGSSANYQVDNSEAVAVDQLYKFAGIDGTLMATAVNPGSVTLKNIDATAGSTVPINTVLSLIGIRGLQGIAGTPGAIVAVGGTLTPVVGGSQTFTINSSLGVMIGHYYGFSGVPGTLLLTAIISPTAVSVQNIDATAGVTIPVDSKLLPVGKTGGQGIGSGDMSLANYDPTGSGSVNNSNALQGNNGAFYLDRVNHTGFQASSTISDFAESIQDIVASTLIAGAGSTITYNDSAGTITISSSGGGGSGSGWITVSSDTAAQPGQKICVDLQYDVKITLPSSASATSDHIFIKRVDDQLQSFIRIDAESVNLDGSSDIGVLTFDQMGKIEELSYCNVRKGYVSQHGRLQYDNSSTYRLSTSLTYASDGDTNGLFYALGSNFGSSGWSNPDSLLLTTVSSSSPSDNLPALTNRTADTAQDSTFTANSTYVAVDLGADFAFLPDYVSVQSGGGSDKFPRSFQISGSVDSKDWVLLLDVVNNTTITGANQWLSLAISGNKYFRYLRYECIAHSAPAGATVILSEWEFYGVLRDMRFGQ